MSTNDIRNTPNRPEIDADQALLAFAEVNESKIASKRQRRIRPRTLSLIIAAVGIVLLTAVLLIVLLHDHKAPTPDDSTDSTSDVVEETPEIILIDKSGNGDAKKATPLHNIEITNQDDAYTISLNEKEKTYFVVGYEDLALDSDVVVTLRTHVEIIKAIEKIKDDSNLKTFGLDQPQASATITYSDGSVVRMHIGDTTPSENGYYGQIEGVDGVYIFASDSVALFHSRAAAYVNTLLMSAPSAKSDDKDGKPLMKEITYSGAQFTSPLTMRRSYSTDSEELSYFTYIITAPYMRSTTDDVSTALSSFTSLKAEQALILHPTAKQKTKLGFDKPLMQLSITFAVETEDADAEADSTGKKPNIYYNGVDYLLTVGSVDKDGNYIAMVDGVDAIFLIDKSTYEYILGRTYENSVNTYLFFRNIKELSRISIQLNSQTYDFKLTHYPNKEDADQQLVITQDNKTYPTADFRKLYQLLMGLKRYGVTDTKPTGKSPLTLSLFDKEGNLYLQATYYDTSGSLCTVQTSEGELFTTRWSDVSFFIQQVNNYLNGKEVLTST